MLAPAFHNHEQEIPLVKTIASQKEGITELKEKINGLNTRQNRDRKLWLLAEKAYHLIRAKRMTDIDKKTLREVIEKEEGSFNLYRFVQKYQ